MTRMVLLLCVVVMAVPARAQDTPGNIKAAELDMSVPTSPAFAVLGLTPDTVLRPASPRELAASLLNGVDSNGILQTGVAIDVAPYFMAKGRIITLEQYETNRALQFLSRLQVSAATAKAADAGTGATRLSGGVRLTFWDRGDYRGNRSFREELSRARNDAADELRDEGITSSPVDRLQAATYNAELDRRLRVRTTAIRERYRSENWNNSALAAGATGTWISRTGEADALSKGGSAMWVSLGYGFEGIPGLENTSQILVHARYRTGDRVPDPNAHGEFLTQDSALAGGRLRVGAVNTNVSFEAVYVRAEPEGARAERFARLTGDVEHRLFDHVWVHVAIGGDRGRDDGGHGPFLLTTLKLAVGPRGQ